MRKGVMFTFLLSFILSVQVFASALTPMDNFYVNDYVGGVLDDSQINNMINGSNVLRSQNGVQVVTVIVPHVIGNDIDEYATNIFNSFGIGSEKDNNGVLLLLALNDGEITILPGDSFRGYMSASKAGSILDEVFMPKVNNNDIAGAIYDTHMELIKVGSAMTTSGEITEMQNNYVNNNFANTQKNDVLGTFIGIIVLIILIIVVIESSNRWRRTGFVSPPIHRKKSFFAPSPIIIVKSSRHRYPGNNIHTYTNKSSEWVGGSRRNFFPNISSEFSSSKSNSSGNKGRSSGGGTSRSFSSNGSSSGSSLNSRSSSSGGRGRSSGGGTSRKF